MLTCISHKGVAQENTKSTVPWSTLLPHCHLLYIKSNEGDDKEPRIAKLRWLRLYS